jgi:hypothetical protein
MRTRSNMIDLALNRWRAGESNILPRRFRHDIAIATTVSGAPASWRGAGCC